MLVDEKHTIQACASFLIGPPDFFGPVIAWPYIYPIQPYWYMSLFEHFCQPVDVLRVLAGI